MTAGFLTMKSWIKYALPFLWFLIAGFNLPDEKKHLGRNIPNITVIDADGQTVSLYSLIQNKPLIIAPVYTRCPSVCTMVSNGAREAIDKLGTLGKEFNVVSFSFDSTDVAADLKSYQYRWKMDGNHWKAVTASENDIHSLMSSIGFEYDTDTLTHQFNHPPLLVIVTPEARISRYIYGVNPSKRDIRIAVLAAQAEKTTPGLFTGIYLRCFGYDPLTKTYKVDWRFIISTSAGLIITFFMATIFIKSFILTKPEHDTKH